MCTLRENIEGFNPRMQETYVAPLVSLREYDNVICVPGQVAVQGNLLLPDSYRHNQQKHLNNRHTDEATPRFARVAADISGPRRLAGTYYYLDNELQGHFGHTMTEQMAKLWGWPRAKEAHPDIKGLVSFRSKAGKVSQAEVRIFDAAGIDESSLVVIDGPVLVEKLVAATPMFSMPAYVHPDIRETWAKVGRSLASTAPDLTIRSGSSARGGSANARAATLARSRSCSPTTGSRWSSPRSFRLASKSGCSRRRSWWPASRAADSSRSASASHPNGSS